MKKSSIGTGPGLSIRHGIGSDHSGSFSIDNVEGKYTTVIAGLPVNSLKKSDAT